MMKAIVVMVTILLSAIGSDGQEISVGQMADPDAVMAGNIDISMATLHLDTLYGKIPVYYSENYKIRARAIQSMVEKCAAFYEESFPEIKFDLQVMILDEKAWRKIHLDEYGSPYGMPTAWYRIDKLFIAADKRAVGKLFGETDSLPDNELSKFDCIALHELGHIFLKRFNHTHIQEKWADEFLASYFAICFFEANKGYAGLPQVGDTNYQPKYRTIHDFERLYLNVGARNYGWYQGKFQELGYRLYAKFGIGLLRRFIATYSSKGKKSAPLVLLKQLAPHITNQWLKEME